MITISNAFLSATINPKGAELTSLKNNSTELMWAGNPDFWGKHAPILFPIVGTLKENKFEHEDETFQMSRHGFARDLVFEVVLEEKQKVIFRLTSNNETLKMFPFDFICELEYILEEKTLVQNFRVKNSGEKPLLFSLGGHPAFALPGNFEEFALRFPQDETLHSFALENDLLTNHSSEIKLSENKLPLHYSLFENDALVIKHYNSEEIQLLKNGALHLRFSRGNFPNLGLWTKIDAPFICIEPWLGYADVVSSTGILSEKEGIINLASAETFQANFSISVP